MTITGPDARSAAPWQAVVDAAMLVLERMGLTPADLLAAPAARPPVPTFAEYIPVVSALVSDGCRKAYGSYWNRVTDQWGSRPIDEPTPSEIRQLVQHVRANVVPRRNSRGGRSAAERLIAALRCMYKHAEEDGLIDPADNPARKVGKPRRLPSTHRRRDLAPPAVPASRGLPQRPPRGRHRRDRAEQLPLVAHHPEIADHPGPVGDRARQVREDAAPVVAAQRRRQRRRQAGRQARPVRELAHQDKPRVRNDARAAASDFKTT